MDTDGRFSICLPCEMGNFISLIGRVVPSLLQFLSAPIGQHAGYLIFHKSNFEKLAGHVKELEAARDRVNNSISRERRNANEIETDVKNWMEKVTKLLQEANQLLEDPRRAEVGCSGWSFPNLILQHQLSWKATEIAKEVVEVQGKGKFDRVGCLPATLGVGSSSTTSTRGDGEKLETRERIKEDIVQALRDPKVHNIGVYGMGGVGKSTLLKEVAQIARQDKLFDAVVMANVSKTPDFKTIQGEIADLLGLRFDEETITGRAYRLQHRIKAERSVLVILDDIWERLDLEKVGIPSPNQQLNNGSKMLMASRKGDVLVAMDAQKDFKLDLEKVGIPSADQHNGCKLLMSSRNKDVLLAMDAQKDFRLDVLNDVEAWSLFQSMAGDEVKGPDLQNVAVQVAKKCAGLPLRIVTVARALKSKDNIYAWKDALKQLNGDDHAGMDAETFAALELSYNGLESGEMKDIFLLLALNVFGDPVEYFLKVAMGLDIFKHITTVEDARNRLHKIIGSLKSSCLLLEGDTNNRIKMHDIVREFATAIAYRDRHVIVRKKKGPPMEWSGKDYLKNCTQIILDKCQIHELPKRLDCLKLKFFILNSANRSLEIPDTLFEGMGSLKVLDLTFLNLSSLPTSFSSLTNLQTLCLDHCVLENMDALGVLKNLEILSLQRSSMTKLPSEIGKLTRLKMLDLSSSGIEVIPPNIISSLTKLEELDMGNTSIKWEVQNFDQNENASLAELRKLSNLTTLEIQISEAWILPRDLIFDKLERYKIVIGDVWEWQDIKYSTLRTLLLKLSTNIHLEHGIRTLIKKVESLCLDEVDGISNVLYQLNGDGFPRLKDLHVQNNERIKYIVDFMERNQEKVAFLILETLVLKNLKNMEEICHGPLAVNSFGKLRVIKVQNCAQLKYLLSFPMVQGLSQLFEIEVCQCNSMKKVVLGDSNASADDDAINTITFPSLRSLTLQHLQTLDNFFSHELSSSIIESEYQRGETCVPAPFFSAQVKFPNLDTLKLSSLRLNKIWNDNQHSIFKLTNLIVENCGGLKYLFSSNVVGSFRNLKRLEISQCDLMDEIIATKERNDDIVESKEVRFSKLETIILKDMENLKTIWHYEFDTLKTLQVKNCDKVVVIFPSSMQKTYLNLEMLEIMDCALVEEIFKVSSNEKSSIIDTMQLKEITLAGLQKLKRIWSMDPQGILSFQNLENVTLENCESLEYIFPYFLATQCSNLKALSINECRAMKEIVAKEGSVYTTPIFEFNQLKELRLWNSLKLKGFYTGNYTLACSSLRKLNVWNCAKLKLFKTLSTSSSNRLQDDKLHVSVPQPLFLVEEVIPNLEMLRISHQDANNIWQIQNFDALLGKLEFLGLIDFENEEATFPDLFLKNAYTLEQLNVEWSSFRKIFQDERSLGEKIHTKIKILLLNKLPKLQHICEEGSQIDPVLEVLELLLVFECPSLRTLLPSSATFSHMTYLEVQNCNGLINLITTSTARSLTKLQIVKIKECNSLEEIITRKGDETICEITFVSLEILVLECLPKLHKFCSNECFVRFPLLEEVVVRECPRMKIFSEGSTSTPSLHKVKIPKNKEKWHWKGNLNDTIKKMFEDKVAYYGLEHLVLSEYPELEDFWYGQIHHNVFYNLKSLVVQRCDFLTNVLFPSNVLQVLYGLEELEVRDCDSLEMVFDVKDIKSKEILSKQNAQLRRLTLSGLPKLKLIWNEDPYEVISFGNLHQVEVFECQSLSYIFSWAMCQDLDKLEVLTINSCGLEVIVKLEERSMKTSFSFPQLTELRLIHLKDLKSFYPAKHTLECSSLKKLSVYRCEALRMFSFNHLLDQVEEIHEMLITLFSIDKVSPNLEELALNGKDAMKILNGYCPKNLFHKVEILHLESFDETPTTFLDDFFAIFPNLVTLQVRGSAFETLFFTKEIGHLNTRSSKQVKNLWLLELEHLNYIWQEDSALNYLIQDFESLYIENCPSLISLLPSSILLNNLTFLGVDSCKGLIDLMTSTTTKSLVQLKALEIKNCEKILDVVKIDEEKIVDEITFENLEYLNFTCLSSLRSFCHGQCTFIFPSLLRLVVIIVKFSSFIIENL